MDRICKKATIKNVPGFAKKNPQMFINGSYWVHKVGHYLDRIFEK